MPSLAKNEKPFEEAILSGNETARRPISTFLSVLGALLALACFPLAAHSISVIGQGNVLDKDPIAEILVLMVLIIFALAVLTSLTKISWSRSHNLASSESLTVMGPLVWRHSHHPPLPHFHHHEICIHGKRFCCGCTGASIGIISGGWILGLVEVTGITSDSSGFLFLTGLACVGVALIPYGINIDPAAPFRVIVNILLPIGLSLIFISARLAYPASNLVLLLGGLTFAAFFISRIWLSGRSHAIVSTASH